MPTRPRYAILTDRSTFHVTWQCHNRHWLLKTDWAKRLYYNLLLKYKDRYQVQIYSYCFMSNHPHLTGFCLDKKLLSDMFRVVNSLFARVYNKRFRRRGQVVMDRFKSPVIQTDFNHLQVMFYIDLNPKRAGMVKHPKEYAWSSFHYYAYGKDDPIITPAPSYLNLGNTEGLRRANYLKMIRQILQNDWKEKRPYSSTPFIGNPDWVTGRMEQLKLFMRLRRQSWLTRFKEKFANTA
ncbi:MAG: transposase [Candidatus Brocadia sp.]|nr:MAG: transposase [Candidatus Brocadia sp.]